MANLTFGQQQSISTPSGGWAEYSPELQRYEVGSRMWSNGGGSIVGYARTSHQLNMLLQTAELESLQSKKNALAKGAVFAHVPSGYAVDSLGNLVDAEDL
jgi:hypothetical protein